MNLSDKDYEEIARRVIDIIFSKPTMEFDSEPSFPTVILKSDWNESLASAIRAHRKVTE